MDHDLRILVCNAFHVLQRYRCLVLYAGRDRSKVPLPLSQHDKLAPCQIGLRIIGCLRSACHQADRWRDLVNVLHELFHEFHIPDIDREADHLRLSQKDAPQNILIAVIDREFCN